jgi:hypothetical protein
MLLRPEYLSQNLDRPLPTKDGGTLRTIRAACDYIASAARTAKADVMTVSRALELALFMDAKLDVSRVVPK